MPNTHPPNHRTPLAATLIVLVVAAALLALWYRNRAQPAPAMVIAAPAPAPPAAPPPAHEVPVNTITGDSLLNLPPAMQACDRAVVALMQRRAAELARRDDPQSLVDAVVLADLSSDGEDDGIAGPALTRAAQLAPDNPEVAWLQLRHCNEGCDRDAAAARVIALEPDNLAGHLVAIQQAKERGDEQAVTRAMSAAQSATRIERRRSLAQATATRQLQSLPAPGACQSPLVTTWMREKLRIDAAPDGRTALDVRAGIAAALPDVSAMVLARVCRPASGEALPADRVAACARLLQPMLQSGWSDERRSALNLMADLHPGDGRQAQWQAQRDALDALTMAEGRLLPRDHLQRASAEGDIAAFQHLQSGQR